MKKKPTVKNDAPYPVGLYALIYDDDGQLKHHGSIVRVEGPTLWVQLFDFMMGDPTSVIPYPMDAIGERCRLYRDRYAYTQALLAGVAARNGRPGPTPRDVEESMRFTDLVYGPNTFTAR